MIWVHAPSNHKNPLCRLGGPARTLEPRDGFQRRLNEASGFQLIVVGAHCVTIADPAYSDLLLCFANGLGQRRASQSSVI